MNKSDYEVWVVGEALIDQIRDSDTLTSTVGGGPANTAKALANLGIGTRFIGAISGDKFGNLISNEMRNYGVDLGLTVTSDLPTATALVQLDDSGVAEYEFNLSNTASFDFGKWLPKGKPSFVYCGGLASVIEPGSTYLYKWLQGIESKIVFDPNVRPKVLNDRTKYREIFCRFAELSTLVKLSEEDRIWLKFEYQEILDLGVRYLMVTNGSLGIKAFGQDFSVSVPAVGVDIVDTIGAGDTVGAVAVEGLIHYKDWNSEITKNILKRSAKAAAITCSRSGAKPPSFMEL